MKVKIIAVASNESAYLAEWIHHHLYFGFDGIEILLNRTNDNSLEILKRISAKHSNVKYRDVSFLDLADVENIQRAAYSIAVNELEDSFTHYIFLDIDEFWVPKDFSSSVQDVVESLKKEVPDANLFSFEWANKVDDLEEFQEPFQAETKLVPDSHLKTLVSTSLTVEKLFAHNVMCKEPVNVLADGGIFSRKPIYKLAESSGYLKNAFVMHRVFRSQIEYIALLGKGRPKFPGLLKDNRHGFNRYNPKNALLFKADSKALSDLNESYKAFLSNTSIADELYAAKESVANRAATVAAQIKMQPPLSYPKMKQCFFGVENQTINSSLEELKQAYVDMLRDQAIGIEKDNVEEACRLMKLAHSLRPRGVLIKNKLDEYKKVLSK